MPNRILRASLRQSLRWNQCPFLAQTFYIRLLTLVDDFGRYEAHPQLLANECFPYGDPDGKPMPRMAIAELLKFMCSTNMIVCYNVDGNEYLQLTRWKEHVRTKSKFPECPKELLLFKCTAVAQQMITSPPTPSPSPTPPPSGVAVELPANFPQTAQEVKNIAGMRCVTEEFALHVWNKAMGRGGLDSKGQEIRNFSSYLATEQKYELDRKEREKHGNNIPNNRPTKGPSRTEGTYNANPPNLERFVK